ncbi:MAG: F0F1 ATP synthase subunit alpha [Actinomycetota bacterium]
MALDINSEKIASLISAQVEKYEGGVEVEETGRVMEAADGIVRIGGLSKAVAGEMIRLPGDAYCLALNLDEHYIGGIVLGDYEKIQEGDIAKRTGQVLRVPVGGALLGRIVDSLGRPVDGMGPIKSEEFRPVEYHAPGVVERQAVNQPLQTGIKAIDAMVPIGRGQRELIVSDRRIGKTALLVDTIINQVDRDVFCIFVIIGQKTSLVARIAERLRQAGAMEYTTIVAATAKEPAALQYLAPYAGCAMGEYFAYRSMHALVMYDDLSKHAVAYRELSLLLRRPPGREAYPGDIFYLHSRLLERSARLSQEKGGGSLTAIPVVEVREGDISGYIPTNLISITDGQIYLDSDLFNAGIRPAVNAGISVSRVGASAQVPAMRKVAGMLRLDLARYREIENFAKFGTELDAQTKKLVRRGERATEILKQPQYQPMPVEDQVLALFLLTHGFLDDVPISRVVRFEEEFLLYMYRARKELVKQLKETQDMDDGLKEGLMQAARDFKAKFEVP